MDKSSYIWFEDDENENNRKHYRNLGWKTIFSQKKRQNQLAHMPVSLQIYKSKSDIFVIFQFIISGL